MLPCEALIAASEVARQPGHQVLQLVDIGEGHLCQELLGIPSSQSRGLFSVMKDLHVPALQATSP